MSVRKGFTLLEMVLVITLIGIIISVALVVINPNSQIAKVRNSQRISDVNTIYSAVEQYFTDNLTYPEGMTTTKKDVCNGSTVVENCIDLSGLVPTYLASVPIDPSGVAYQIYINSDNNRIGVEAAGSELGQSIALNLISTTTPSTPTPTPTPTPAVTATGGNITTINENGT
ncbi:MAG: type II secretion system protein, partial [Minisyncoccia bacterium]